MDRQPPAKEHTMTQATQDNPIVTKDAPALARLRMGLHALAVLKNDQGNPYYAALLHTSFDYGTYARLAEVLRQTPEGRRFLDERRTIPGDGVDIEALSRLPKGTLGHEFARYLIDNDLKPFSYEYPLESDGEFLYKRYRETHDLHHIITGYGVDPIGEVELQAFYFGNLGLRHAGLIALLSIPYQLSQTGLDLAELRQLLRRLRAAYRRGQDSRELLSVGFDELWDKPVSELARLICSPAPSYA
jgi:ubiquinone biosynthesis protein COQ4